MIANDRTEIAQTVKTARRARRPMYASTVAPPAPTSLLVVERDRPRDGRRLPVRAVVLARRDVAEVRLDDAHAVGRGADADHPDDVDLLGGDLPDLLAELDPFLLRHAEGLLPLLHQLLHPRLRLLALRAGGMEPLDVERPGGGHRGQLEGEHVEREGEEVLAAVVVPRAQLLLVRGGALEREAALDLLHLEVDADLLPLLADHLRDLRVLHELPAQRHDLDAEPALAVRAKPIALRVLLREPDLVEHLVGLLDVERRPQLPVLRPGVVLVGVRRHHRARRARAEPERLVDLVAVDPERQRAP